MSTDSTFTSQREVTQLKPRRYFFEQLRPFCLDLTVRNMAESDSQPTFSVDFSQPHDSWDDDSDDCKMISSCQETEIIANWDTDLIEEEEDHNNVPRSTSPDLFSSPEPSHDSSPEPAPASSPAASPSPSVISPTPPPASSPAPPPASSPAPPPASSPVGDEASATGTKRRYQEISSEERDSILSNLEAKNTKKMTLYSVKLFKG